MLLEDWLKYSILGLLLSYSLSYLISLGKG